MKYFLLLISSFLLNTFVAQITQNNLTVKGLIGYKNSNNLAGGAIIEIFKRDSILVNKTVTNKNGEYSFQIPLNIQNLFLVKTSYLKTQKLFLISTKHIPKKRLETPFKNIEINLIIFPSDSTKKFSITNIPVTKYIYNPEENDFEMDEDYGSAISRIYEVYEKVSNKNSIILKNEAENKIKETELSRQKLLINSFLIGLALLFLIVFLVYRNLLVNKKQSKIISEQKRLVEEKNKEMLDSIHYAKRIQTSLITSEKYIDKTLKRLIK